MTKRETIKVLTEMNKWRRGEKPYDSDRHLAPYAPSVYGEAIDTAVKLLSKQ